jgi:hypothetical protein
MGLVPGGQEHIPNPCGHSPFSILGRAKLVRLDFGAGTLDIRSEAIGLHPELVKNDFLCSPGCAKYRRFVADPSV